MKRIIRYKKVKIVEYPVETNLPYREIGKQAGIHFTFISKALNGLLISEDTAQKIIEENK